MQFDFTTTALTALWMSAICIAGVARARAFSGWAVLAGVATRPPRAMV